ncbi:MAG: DUF6466 family protein [Bifidobacterium sp.]|uniref:DUF6466 family protein n=1 Tax=Bifidobacterium sp. TaxID=41200 RepID=UPI003F0A547D
MTATNGTSNSLPEPPTTGAKRAALAVRIALVVLACLALALAIVAAANLQAQSAYNQATASLKADLAASAKATADWSTLAARQEQTDDQFAEAATWNAVLLPELKQLIAANSATSHTLTKRIAAELKQQQGAASSSSADSGDGSAQQPSASSSPSSSQDGLNDEQRQQVQDLLKSNQSPSPSPSTSSTTGTTTPTPSGSVKPW